MIRNTLFLCLLSSALWAGPTCTNIDSTGYSQDQINLVPALSYALGYAQDTSTLPPFVSSLGTTVTVCFTNPSFDPVTVITKATLTTQYQSDQAVRVAAAAQNTAWATELSTTTTAVVNGWANFASLTQAQINAGVKNIVRIFMLRKLLGIDP